MNFLHKIKHNRLCILSIDSYTPIGVVCKQLEERTDKNMKEIFTRNDGSTAIVSVVDGMFNVEFNGDVKKYKNYGNILNYLTKNGFSIFLKKIVRG